MTDDLTDRREAEALRVWRAEGKAPAGICPHCGSTISVVQRDGWYRARCSHRGCWASGPQMHKMTRAVETFVLRHMGVHRSSLTDVVTMLEQERDELRAEVERLEREREEWQRTERHEAFDRGRAVGREDVGKYARAIGEIEAVLGITGAQPMSATVETVRRLVAHGNAEVDLLKRRDAEVERLRRDRDSYANSDFERQLSEARAEVERLRAELARRGEP